MPKKTLDRWHDNKIEEKKRSENPRYAYTDCTLQAKCG